jgi:hypothetical protein
VTNALGVKRVKTGEKNVTSTLLSSIIHLCADILLLCLNAALVFLAQYPVCMRCKEVIIFHFAMKYVKILEILIFYFKFKSYSTVIKTVAVC